MPCWRIENGGFILKTHQMFSVYSAILNLKMQKSIMVILNLCLRKMQPGKSHDYREPAFLERSIFISCPHGNKKPIFSKSVFKKSFFCDGLV